MCPPLFLKWHKDDLEKKLNLEKTFKKHRTCLLKDNFKITHPHFHQTNHQHQIGNHLELLGPYLEEHQQWHHLSGQLEPQLEPELYQGKTCWEHCDQLACSVSTSVSWLVVFSCSCGATCCFSTLGAWTPPCWPSSCSPYRCGGSGEYVLYSSKGNLMNQSTIEHKKAVCIICNT